MDILSLLLAKSNSSKLIDKILSHYYDSDGNLKLKYKKDDIETNIPTSDELEKVKLVAEGAHQAVSYDNYEEFVSDFNFESSDKHNVGQNIYIVTDGVPDLWVQEIAEISSIYTYTNDNAIVTALNTQGYIQVGYYIIGHLETQKIDLENYVKFTDHATNTKVGVVRGGNGLGIMDDGEPFAHVRFLNDYLQVSQYQIIGKGTLENIKEDYVRRALTSSDQDEYTEEEKENVNALIGSVPKSSFIYDENTETLSIIL